MNTMTMNTMTMNSLKKDLAEALIILSKGKLKVDIAEKIASKSVNNVDLGNSALVHKGTNWYAKEILKQIKFA